jgi:hypothetical protein
MIGAVRIRVVLPENSYCGSENSFFPKTLILLHRGSRLADELTCEPP